MMKTSPVKTSSSSSISFKHICLNFIKKANAVLLIVSVVCLTLGLGLPVCAASVSPALDILSRGIELVKTGSLESDISFTASDFDRIFGKKVSSITVTSLPPITDGVLMVGAVPAVSGQAISRSNIKNLHFVPVSAGESESRFTFSGNGMPYDVQCVLYTISGTNYAPTASLVNEKYFNVSTFKDTAYFGTMKAVDPENDALKFELISVPKKGTLIITDSSYGNYEYIPTAGFTGRDSFKYVACDKYGNYSETITVKISVSKPVTSVVYSDMNGHWASNAAQKLTAAGIMTGEASGSAMMFNPSNAVSRCEFLVYAMKAAGYKVLGNSVNTDFIDNSEIPSEYKGYVAAAVERGFIKGVRSDVGYYFYPNNEISRAEAAVILNNILGLPQPVISPVFADQTVIPTWASGAIYSLSDAGILNGTGAGYISPYAALTRAQTAQIISSVMDYKA